MHFYFTACYNFEKRAVGIKGPIPLISLFEAQSATVWMICSASHACFSLLWIFPKLAVKIKSLITVAGVIFHPPSYSNRLKTLF